MDIPDHPAVAMTLATGYPNPEPDPVLCEECGEEISSYENVFIFDGEAVCENCCRDRIEENFDVADLARALNITVKSMANYLAEMEGD